MKLSTMILDGLNTRPERPMPATMRGYFSSPGEMACCADPLGFAYLSLAGATSEDPPELVTRRLRGAFRDFEQTLRNAPRFAVEVRSLQSQTGVFKPTSTVAHVVTTLHRQGFTPERVAAILAAGGY